MTPCTTTKATLCHPQAEEAGLRASLDECARQAPGEEALLMIGHLPPSQPRGQSAAEMQEVPLVF